jgi:hypothetical protein
MKRTLLLLIIKQEFPLSFAQVLPRDSLYLKVQNASTRK